MIPYILLCVISKIILFRSPSHMVHTIGVVIGVYRLAKELQLLDPALFDNIILDLGDFHMEKVMIPCCGKYL